MLSIERLSHLFVATLRCNATQVTNHTLSMCAFLRGTKNIPLSEAARQAKNVHGSEALHCLCLLTMKHVRYYRRTKPGCLAQVVSFFLSNVQIPMTVLNCGLIRMMAGVKRIGG